ncbi:hypothetical protein [Arthrobacter sp. HY1533]|uniref:hypothetical protein n=1 Tax=Arthrobacter sp. HY1533 TaxID=2970919 RepID=UPI0022B9E292|nr:hypothetical protein [Arthrobacter sp. HY1533]
MVYQVPASKASIKQNRFEFTLHGSKKIYSIPLMKFIKPSLVIDLDGNTDKEAMGIRLFREYLPDVFPLLEDSEQLEALMAAWQDASGITVGESSASAT